MRSVRKQCADAELWAEEFKKTSDKNKYVGAGLCPRPRQLRLYGELWGTPKNLQVKMKYDMPTVKA